MWAYIPVKACKEEGAQNRVWFCLISDKRDQLIRIFFGQEPSLDCKDSFEQRSSFLDQMVQKLRAYKGLYVFPFPGLIYRYLDLIRACL